MAGEFIHRCRSAGVFAVKVKTASSRVGAGSVSTKGDMNINVPDDLRQLRAERDDLPAMLDWNYTKLPAADLDSLTTRHKSGREEIAPAAPFTERRRLQRMVSRWTF